MKTIAKRPRIATRINVLHDDATVYVLDNTRRKQRITAEVMIALRDNERIANRLGHSVADVNQLFPYSKISRMIVKAINKGKVHTYRNENLSAEVTFDTTPIYKTADIDSQFRKRQRESIKRAAKQTAQADAQADILQVA